MTEAPDDGSDVPSRATCVAHRLVYNPELYTGCVLCARPEAPPAPSLSMVQVAVVAVIVSAGSAVATHRLTHKAPAPATHRAAYGQGQDSSRSVGASATTAASHEPMRVLFIGNSLTETNDLPGMIASLAAAAGEARPFSPGLKALGGFCLSNHLAGNYVPALLSEHPWDAVVLQEQGQRAGWGDDLEGSFYLSVRKLDAMIRAAGARTVLYETFARREGDPTNFKGDDYAAMQRRVHANFARAAYELRAELVPVGSAWARVVHERPDLNLWDPDGMHPSVAGTYLAACVFYARLYQRSPVGNSYRARLDATVALELQKYAAREALAPAEALESSGPSSRDLPPATSDALRR